jgi:type IV pilus assembly protein PilF
MSFCRVLIVLALALPGCVTATSRDRASSRTTLGQAYIREQNPAAAIRVLEEAVKLDRYNYDAWQTLALAYMNQNVMDRSEEAFQRALSLAPDQADVHNNYALLLLTLERNEEAIKHFEIALQDFTYRSPILAMTNLGYALYLEGRYAEALDHLTMALSTTPSLCQALYNRGLVYRNLGESDLALADFQEAIDYCDDRLGSAYLQAAEIMIAGGDIYGGCQYLSVLAQKNPHSSLGRAARENRARNCL